MVLVVLEVIRKQRGDLVVLGLSLPQEQCLRNARFLMK